MPPPPFERRNMAPLANPPPPSPPERRNMVRAIDTATHTPTCARVAWPNPMAQSLRDLLCSCERVLVQLRVAASVGVARANRVTGDYQRVEQTIAPPPPPPSCASQCQPRIGSVHAFTWLLLRCWVTRTNTTKMQEVPSKGPHHAYTDGTSSKMHTQRFFLLDFLRELESMDPPCACRWTPPPLERRNMAPLCHPPPPREKKHGPGH